MTAARVSPSSTGLERDRLSWMLYLSVATYGYFLYGFGVSVPLLRDELQISRSEAGLHGTALACGSVVAGLWGARLIARFGRDAVLWTGSAMMCIGVVTYCTGQVAAVTLLGALIAGSGGALLLNIVNAVMMDRHGFAGPAALSEANAFGSGAGVVAPLVIGAVVAVGLGWRAGLLVSVLLVVVVRTVFRRERLPAPLLPAAPVTAFEGADGTAAPHRRLPPAFWITWGVFACVIAVEFCLALWVSDELRVRDNLAAGPASAGVAAVLVGLTVSRVAGGKLGLRHGVDWLLDRSIAVLLLGFAGFWLTASPWVALPSLLVCGLGLGMLAPLTIGRSVVAAGGRSDLAVARTSLGAGLAIGAGPFLIGAIADRTSVHAAFLLVPVLLVLALLGLAISRPLLANGGRGRGGGGGREWVDGKAGG